MPRKHPGFDFVARAGESLKIHFIARDFDQHECAIGVESLLRHSGFCQVAIPQLAGRTFGEVVDAFLRLDPLVDVVVAGKHRIHAVLDEHWFDQRPQLNRGTVSFSR